MAHFLSVRYVILWPWSLIFTVWLHAMHGIVKAILSVRLSVCQTRALWQNERNLYPHYYTIWKITHRSFLKAEWFLGTTSFTWNFGPNWPCLSETPIFNRYPLVAPPPTAKKFQLTLIGSTRLPTSLRWTSMRGGNTTRVLLSPRQRGLTSTKPKNLGFYRAAWNADAV